MTNGFWILLGVLIGSTPLAMHAQPLADSTTSGIHSGRWAIQFQVTPGLSLEAFDGATIAGKFHTKDHSAFRLSVAVAQVDSTGDGESLDEQLFIDNEFSDFRQLGGRNDGERWFIDIALVYLKYIQPATSIQMYLGIGPGFSMDLNNRSSDSEVINVNRQDNQSLVQFERETEDIWGGGLHFLIGAEWFVLPRISILAEYNTEVFYSVFTSTRDSHVERENPVGATLFYEREKEHQFTVNGQPVRLGVSVYF